MNAETSSCIRLPFFVTSDCDRTTSQAQSVWIDPDRMSGAPCFTGMRVPVQMLLDHPKHGDTIQDFLEGAPTVN